MPLNRVFFPIPLKKLFKPAMTMSPMVARPACGFLSSVSDDGQSACLHHPRASFAAWTSGCSKGRCHPYLFLDLHVSSISMAVSVDQLW
jgi:hypothetical protein